MKLKLIALTGAILLSFSNLKAQTTSTFTPTHLKAAEQFLIVTGQKDQFDVTLNNAIKQGANTVDINQHDAYIKVMTAFVGKYLSWEVLKDKLAAICAAEFTQTELNQLNLFYSSAVAKKFLTKSPELLKHVSSTTMEIVAAHKTELDQNLTEAYKHTDPPAVKELGTSSQSTSKH